VAEPINKYDLVVVGGGLAGMTAGVRALELGLRAAVLEKGEGEIYPCNTRQSGGVMHIGFLDPYRPAEDLDAVIDQRSGGEADKALSSALSKSGGRFLDWLQERGARFVKFNEQEGYRWCMAPPRSLRAGIDWQGRGPDVVLRRLVERFGALGGCFCDATRAESLVMHEGQCIGVVAEKKGVRETVKAAQVLISDGGFQANPDLYREHIGAGFERMFQRGARTGMGDGLKMAVAAGAAIKGVERFYGHVLCRDALHNDNVWPYPEIDGIATAGMVVNGTGQRIADEGISGVYLTNALAAALDDEPLYAIFDAAIWDKPGRSARIPANPLLEEAGGTVLRANSLEDLAALAGVAGPGLVETVTQYNAALVAGELDRLAVPRSTAMQPWPIIEAPFMAIPVCPGITYTMGGIAIDAHAQVLAESGEPIKGLLAAGAATGGIEGGSQAGYIGGLMKAGVFGLLAAERAAVLCGKPVRNGLGDKVGALSLPPHLASSSIAVSVPPRRHRLAKYPMLRAIVGFGTLAAILLSVAVAGLVLWLCWSSLGVIAISIAGLAGLVSVVIALSYAELVRLITDIMMPE
jgi:fumarate reductase flavoprotein subunit